MELGGHVVDIPGRGQMSSFVPPPLDESLCAYTDYFGIVYQYARLHMQCCSTLKVSWPYMIKFILQLLQW